MPIAPRADSLWSLRFDVLWVKVLVSLVSIGREVELRSDAHLYLFDRYSRLARVHDRQGHKAKARALRAKADAHYEASGGDGPPYAAAMAMPRPRRWIVTDARSNRRLSDTARPLGDAPRRLGDAPLRLVHTERKHRVDAGGAPGGEIAGD